MLNLLKNNHFSGLVVCLLILAGIFVAGYYSEPFPIDDYDNAGILFRLMLAEGWHNFLPAPYLQICIFLAILLMGLLQLLIINRFEMLYKKTWIPLFFFVSTHFVFSHSYYLTPSFFLLLIMIAVARRFLLLDNTSNKVTGYLDIGLFMGIGLLFDLNIIFYLPFLIIAFLITGFFSFKRLLVFFSAFIIPLYFLFVICYATNNTAFFLANSWKPISFGLDLKYFETIPTTKWVVLSLLIFFLLYSGFEMQANYYKNTLLTRRAHQFVFLMLLASTVIVFVGFSKFYSVFNYFALTINIFASYYLIKNKKNIIREGLFWMFIISIILSNYLKHF